MSKKSLTAKALMGESAPTGGVLDNVVDQDILMHDEEYTRLQSRLPLGVNVQEALEFGFYEYKNRYWMRRSGGGGMEVFDPVSNFTMKVLYLIVGANPKRIVQITNVHRKSVTIDFAIEDLISLEKFKGKVESQGNFLFDGKAQDLGRIKNKLFTLEQPSIEISRLGQYKDKFFAFANGVYDGRDFTPVDDKGMVDLEKEHYYIPVFGSTRDADDEDLRNYRKFVHREDSVTFEEWARLFVEVYGDNGIMGIGFFIFALFSDLIFEKTKAAPMLFLFGQRGSGKGTMANSLLALYGYPQDPLMLGGASTVVGFMRKLGQFTNAITWLDEYKNDIGEKKIESLKNIWDRVGYERGTKDQSNRTQVTPVTSSAIISGQEMPNVEPALFSRTVLCEFRSMARTQFEVDKFDQLRRMEESGITNVTLEVLSLREAIKAEFVKNYAEIAAAYRKAMLEEDVIERQIINTSIIGSCIMTLEKKLKMPFNSVQFLQIGEAFMKRQRDMMKTSNEVQQFFEMVQFLLANGLISSERDIHISKGLVKMRLVSIIGLYREYTRRQGLRPMDKGTLQNYLSASEAFCESESKQSSHRFPGLTNPTSAQVFLQAEIKRLYGVDLGDNLQDIDNEHQTPQTPPENVF